MECGWAAKECQENVRGLLAERASTLRRRWRKVRAFHTATLDPKWYGHLLEALASRQQQNYLVGLQQPTDTFQRKSGMRGWSRAREPMDKFFARQRAKKTRANRASQCGRYFQVMKKRVTKSPGNLQD